MTDDRSWIFARNQQGQQFAGQKLPSLKEVRIWDKATKKLLDERVPLPADIILSAATQEQLFEIAKNNRGALNAVDKISAAPLGSLFSHGTCEGGAPVIVVGYDGLGGVRLAKQGGCDSWSVGFEGEVTVPMASVHEIRFLSEEEKPESKQETMTSVVMDSLTKGFDRGQRPLRYGHDILRCATEGGKWISHAVGVKRTREAEKDLARFCPKLHQHLKANDGQFPDSKDPLLQECVLFTATYFAVKIGRETTTHAYEKWAKEQGQAVTQITDKDLSDIFVANGAPWMCPASRIFEEEQRKAAGAGTTAVGGSSSSRGGFGGRGNGARGRGGGF